MSLCHHGVRVRSMVSALLKVGTISESFTPDMLKVAGFSSSDSAPA